VDELQPKLALRLAHVMLHWAWQHYDEAFRQLEELSTAHPRNGNLKSLLLRANLERDRLDEAQRWMNELTPDGDGSSVETSSDIGYLQRQLRQRWTKRLHWQDLVGHAGAVSDLAVDPTGQWLASVGVDGTVRMWEVKSGRQVRLLQDRGDLLLAVAFSPDGSELAAAGYDRSVRRWRVNDGTPLPPLVGHQDTVRTLDYSPDGRSLVSGADDHQLILWNLSTAQAAQRLDGHRGAVLSARFMPDGRRIVSSGRDQTLRWWKIADGQLQSTVSTTQGTLRSIVPLAEFDGILAAGEDRTLRFWAFPQAAAGATPAWPVIRAAGSIGDVAHRTTEPLVAFGGDDRTVQMWDLSTGRQQFALAGHTGRVLSVARSPDGRWLASAGFDGIIKLWRLQ
jgi:WD40 repeat protein